MRIRSVSPIARIARPIITERDYRVVKSLIAERARTFFLIETVQLEALIRELTDYEGRLADAEVGVAVEKTEWAPMQSRNDPHEQNRRWCDTIDHACANDDSPGECLMRDRT